ncbi:unnamed protein product [Paramecium sonneborni]|uniref:Uncharacterized protein n=1 Tax=Paramecium sonneborni TaxID=65129 RepID=A0A8S1RFH9_9CILI|nr:unnamed protein product [Paramecium sonneborni]
MNNQINYKYWITKTFIILRVAIILLQQSNSIFQRIIQIQYQIECHQYNVHRHIYLDQLDFTRSYKPTYPSLRKIAYCNLLLDNANTQSNKIHKTF